MTVHTAIAAAPAQTLRRGACPTLAEPMPTGDGLLARLRPASGRLTPAQLVALAEAATRHGNGLVEITARGSFQIRGLTADTAPRLRQAVTAAGIAVAEGLSVEISPLAGNDPDEIADARALRDAIRAYGNDLAGALAPKFTLVVDGGGAGLTARDADLRITAIGPDRWAIASGERVFGALNGAAVPAGVRKLLFAVAALGPAARGRDLPADIALAGAEAVAVPAIDARPVIGTRRLHRGFAVGLGLPFGQVEARTLADLARLAEALGATAMMAAPHRVLLAEGPSEMQALRRQARDVGLVTEAGDARLSVSACPGSPRCASGRMASRNLAEVLVALHPELTEGLSLHVSGCAKGCAHPRPADLSLFGQDGAIAIAAGSAELLRIGSEKILPAMARLAALCRDNRLEGETTASVIARLGHARLAACLAAEQE